MSSSKPVFLLVSGGWHPPAAYDKLKVQLEANGYEYYCPHLPSLGPAASGVTYEADVDTIREVALPLFDQGREVILIAHSAGGVPAVVAAQGLEVASVPRRVRKGLQAHHIPRRRHHIHPRLRYPPTLGGSWQPGQGGGEPYTKGHLMKLAEGAEKTLYSDLPEEEARKYYNLFQPHSQDAFETPVNYIAADLTIPKTYIVTENDMAFPAFAQRALAATLPDVQIESIETSHSPFASQPENLAAILVRIAATSE